MFTAALGIGQHEREDAVRVARIVRRLHLDAVAELGEREADELVGATLTLIRARVVDIFGAESWDGASPGDTT